jgi:hypothetical protein
MTDSDRMRERSGGDRLSLGEIESRFDSEWVLIGDPELDEQDEILSGCVLVHDKNRDEMYRQARILQPKRSAVLFTGLPPADMEFAISLGIPQMPDEQDDFR